MEEGPEAVYEGLWRDAVASFARGRFELDEFIDGPNDTRRGLSLIARPDAAMTAELVVLQAEFREVASEQYLPALDELHVTVLSIVSCASGYSLDRSHANAYATLVGCCLDGLSTFEIDFRGLTASPSCIMVRGYPLETTLGTIRSRLRDGFGSSTLHHTMESRYPARPAHATNDWYHRHAEVHWIARFALQPQSPPG